MPESIVRSSGVGQSLRLRRIEIDRRPRHPPDLVDETVVGNPEQPRLEITDEPVGTHVGPDKGILRNVVGPRSITPAQRGQEPPERALACTYFCDEPVACHRLRLFIQFLLFCLDLLGKHLLADKVNDEERDTDGQHDSTRDGKESAKAHEIDAENTE